MKVYEENDLNTAWIAPDTAGSIWFVEKPFSDGTRLSILMERDVEFATVCPDCGKKISLGFEELAIKYAPHQDYSLEEIYMLCPDCGKKQKERKRKKIK